MTMPHWLATFLTHPTVLISIGGALGCNARYWTGVWFRGHLWAQQVTWGTLCVNVAGSLVLGIVAAVWKDRTNPWFLLLGTGFCGGFTTFSTFSMEVIEAIQNQRWDLAAAYTASSVGAAVLAFAAAHFLIAR